MHFDVNYHMRSGVEYSMQGIILTSERLRILIRLEMLKVYWKSYKSCCHLMLMYPKPIIPLLASLMRMSLLE